MSRFFGESHMSDQRRSDRAPHTHNLVCRVSTATHADDGGRTGLFLGLGAGLAATELWVYDQCGGRGSDRECEVIVSLVGWTALGIGGAVGGALIDKFHNKLVYRAGSKAVVKVTPQISPARQAVAVSLTF